MNVIQAAEPGPNIGAAVYSVATHALLFRCVYAFLRKHLEITPYALR